MIRKQLAILLTIGLFGSAVAYFVAQGRDEIGEMQLQAVAGDVRIERDGEIIEFSDEATIEIGDVIRTGSGGEAQLRLTGDRRAWLAPHSRVLVADITSLSVLSGDLLAEAQESMLVSFDGIDASASGARFRVDQGAGAARAASYEGEILLSSPGQPRLEIDTLFEAQITAGRLPSRPKPLQVREDTWDLQHIGDVIELDDQLTSRGNGFESQLGKERPGTAYFRRVAGRPVPFMRPVLRRPVKDLLIGFTIAANGKGSLKRGVKETFRLRDDGGRWGVVAAIRQAQAKALLADLGSMIVATGVVGGPARTADGQADFTLAAAGSGSGAVGSTSSGPSGSTTDDSTGPTGGTKDGDEEPPSDCGSSTECWQQDIEKQIPSLPGSSPSPSPSDPPLGDGLLDGLED